MEAEIANVTAQGNSAYRWWVLFVAFLVQVFVVGAAWTIMPVLFAEIAQPQPAGLGLNLIELGTVWGGFSLATAIFSIPMGIAADRYEVRWVIGGGLLLAAVAGACRATSIGFLSLLVWMFLFGIGYSTIRPNLAKLIGVWFPPHELGMSNGIVMGSYGLGAGLAIQFGGSHLSPAVGGWRNLLWLLGAIVSGIAILWLITVRSRRETQPVREKRRGPSRQGLFYSFVVALRTRDVWWLMLSQITFSMGYIGAIGFLPVYLVDRGIAASEAHAYVSLLLYSYVAGAIVVPLLSDRLCCRRWAYFFAIVVNGAAVMTTAFATGPVLALAFLVWGFFTGGVVLTFVIPLEHPEIGPGLAGATVGLLMAMASIGGFVSPIIGNAVALQFGGAIAIVAWGVCFMVAACIFLLVRETHPGREGGAQSSQVPTDCKPSLDLEV